MIEGAERHLIDDDGEREGMAHAADIEVSLTSCRPPPSPLSQTAVKKQKY